MIPLRALNLGEILDASFRLYRATFVDVALLVAITLGAFNALAAIVQGPQPGLLDAAALEATNPVEQGVRILLSLGITLLAALFVQPIVRGAVTGIALEQDRGGDSSWQAGLRFGLRLAARLLGQGFLVLGLYIGVFIALGLVFGLPIALLFQGDQIALGVVFVLLGGLATLAALALLVGFTYLAVPAMVVEDVGPWTSLKRSFALARPQWLRVIGIVILTALLLGIVSGMLGVLNGVVAGVVGGVVGVVSTILLTTIGVAVTVPLQANIALLLYVDSRVRVEGLDVAVLTAELDRA